MNEEQMVDNTAIIHGLLAERLAPALQAGQPYSIDRQADINDIRAALDNPDVARAVADVLVEHQRAVRKWPEWPTDTTHAAAILAGEGGECLKAANHYREGRPTEGRDSLFMVEFEAIQAGAMAVRLLSNHPRKVAQ